jgi:glucose-6-phosphate isomerase
MLSLNVGSAHGVTEIELAKITPQVLKGLNHLERLLKNKENRINLGLEWANLPYQDKKIISELKRLAKEISKNYENVIFLGIGGSYLGLKAAQDALCPAYYNEFAYLRKNRPKIYFEGNNLDPDTLKVLLKSLNPKKTFVVVISKSGETTETKAALMVVEEWLKNSLGALYGRQVVAITDPAGGTLRKRVDSHQKKDKLSFRNFPLLKGVGGRYSEFNMGLLHLAVCGVDIDAVLSGAKNMAVRCVKNNIFDNPAAMYAALQVVLYLKKEKAISILMPFSESLKSTADWYCQLLAESTGKKYRRLINVSGNGAESWSIDKTRVVNAGRTPVASRGTNDLHSIQQNNIEGENNKSVTFIRVEKFASDIRLPEGKDLLSGKYYSGLLSLAQEATEWALVNENRPNCTIIMPRLDPFHWGELIYFFEMATAFEGELLNINAFDQPGVEGYKNYMYFKLKKPGLSGEIEKTIKSKPLIKNKKFII